MLLWKRWHFHLGHNKLEVCVALALSDSSTVGGQAALVPLPPLLSHHTEVRAVAGLGHLEPKSPVQATARSYLHTSVWCGRGDKAWEVHWGRGRGTGPHRPRGAAAGQAWFKLVGVWQRPGVGLCVGLRAHLVLWKVGATSGDWCAGSVGRLS